MQRSGRQAVAGVTAMILLAGFALLTPVTARATGPGSAEGSATLAVGAHQVAVAGRLGVGWLSGESTETVYDTETGRKLSELVWDLDSVFMLNAGASIEPTPWLRLNADVWFRMNDGSGSMDDYDYVLAMDRENLADLRALAPHSRKPRLFLDYAPDQPLREVPDPYYNGAFAATYDLVLHACRGLLDTICREHGLTPPTRTPQA